MKKIKSIFGVILSLVIIISASNIYNVSAASSSKGGYEITSYDVNIEVTEGNVLKVKETIDVFFDEPRHGIFRNIPLNGTVVRNDGSSGKFKAKISNIRVNESYSTSTAYGATKVIELKIGSASSYVSGNHRYVISYDYALGKDETNDYDELYYNIIGSNWDAKINKTTFRIEMPKEFDASKVGFTHGTKGSVDTDGMSFEVDGNVITGEYNGTLGERKGLTIRLELPEGYFKVIDYRAYIEYGIITLFILFGLWTFILWAKNGKDKPIVETVEFYPPEGLNSLETGFAYKGKATGKDVTSLLIYLANKGYLKIEEKEKSIFSYDSFKIIKLKEYDGNNEAERMFFEGLFRSRDEVTTSDLSNRFYITQNRILKLINSKSNENKIIDKKSKKNKNTATILQIIIFIIIFLIIGSVGEIKITAIMIMPFIVAALFILKTAFKAFASKNVGGIISGIIMLFMGLQFFFMPQIALAENYIELNKQDWITIGVGVVSIIIIGIFSAIMTTRTEYGTQILGKIRGFKRFLTTARKDELERLVIEHPTYFYDILPFTYVLGVSEKWIKKFESINISSPDWYDSPNTFSVSSFGSSMNRTFRSTNSAMTTSPSSSGSSSGSRSSSGGGHSGGGHSGGGSGGGGGGSW